MAFVAFLLLGTKLLCGQASAAAKPAPDVLVFVNGDTLSGTLLRGVGKSVVFKSEMAGEITVPLEKIKELRSTGSFAVLRNDVPVTRAAVQTGPLIYSDKNITIASPGVTPVTVPAAEVGYLIDKTTYDRELSRRAGPLTGWNGSILGGATLVRSTTNDNTFTAGISLYRAIPAVPYLPARNRTTVNVQETYGKQTSPGFLTGVAPNPVTGIIPAVVIKTNVFHADAERDEYFSPRFYVLAQSSFDHNYAQGLDLQATYGIGVGWTPFKTANQQLDVKADVHYETQKFFSLLAGTPAQATQNLIGSTFAEAYRWNLPRKLVFTESANVLPAWNNLDAYSANASAALTMPLFRRLSLQFSTTDNFLNNPAPLFKKNSYQFVTGLTYNLR